MTICTLTLTLALAASAIPSASLAQDEHRATVLLRNGDRVSGNLEDVENGTVYVRVSLNDQRKLDLGDVVLIDFAGGASGLPETELSAARGNNHLALMRGGDSWQGRFVDIRGGEADATEAHALIFRTTDGREQRVGLNNVARIYLGNFPGSAPGVGNPGNPGLPPASNDPVPAGAVRVPGNMAWVSTGITVRRGQAVSFNTTGQVQLSDNGNDVAHAAGALSQRRANGSPLPQHFAGALIARIGNSAPFPIGDNSAPIPMPADGQLFLGINDDEVSDNRGEFIVRVMPARR